VLNGGNESQRGKGFRLNVVLIRVFVKSSMTIVSIYHRTLFFHIIYMDIEVISLLT
jgi:hypothetical protein